MKISIVILFYNKSEKLTPLFWLICYVTF